jgi:putative ABC transport system permease protein
MRTAASLLQDIQYGFRTLRRKPGVAIFTILAIAVGTGANTAMFTAIHSAIWRPLPFAEPDRLTTVQMIRMPDDGKGLGAASYPDFTDLKEANRTFESLAAYYTRDLVMTGREEPLRVNVAFVTPELFKLLGREAFMGSALGAGPGSETPRVVLSYGMWERQFAGDPGVLGRGVTINGSAYVVNGVMPPEFQFPIQAHQVDMWVDLGPVEGMLTKRRARILDVIGRLKPGVTPAQADADLKSLADALGKQHPQTNANVTARVIPLTEKLFGDMRRPMFVLFAAVGFVLVIACVTVANLLIAQGAARKREISTRFALGASRMRIIRQLLTEHMLLTFIGGAAGVLLGIFACRLLTALSPFELLRLREVKLDYTVMLFAIGVVILTGIGSGLTPALRLAGTDISQALREHAGGSGQGLPGRTTQSILVVSQLTITLVLLIGAALLIRDFWRLSKVNLGIDTSNILTMKVALPDSYDPKKTVLFYQQLRERLKATPSVVGASSVAPLPLIGANLSMNFEVPGRTSEPGAQPSADMRVVEPGFFRLLGIPLVEGRDFDEHDTADSPPKAIVNAAFVRKYFEGVSPVGRTIMQRAPITVVGVVGNMRSLGAHTEPRPEIYLPFLQMPTGEMTLVMKTNSNPSHLIAAARAAVRELDPNLPTYDQRTLDDYLAATTAPQRFIMGLLMIFAGVSLLLTIIGLHGVVAQFVAYRRREIAIRVALGAPPSRVLKLVVGESMALVAVGLALGLFLALALTRFMSSLLFGVSATDPLTFGTVLLVLAGVAFIACYLPARYASRIEPIEVLRTE